MPSSLRQTTIHTKVSIRPALASAVVVEANNPRRVMFVHKSQTASHQGSQEVQKKFCLCPKKTHYEQTQIEHKLIDINVGFDKTRE